MTMNVIPGSIQVLSKSPKKNKRLKRGVRLLCPHNMCRWIGATRPDLRAHHVPPTAGRFSRYNVF